MTGLEWDKLEEILAYMTPKEKDRLLALVNASITSEANSGKDPLLGLMAEESKLIDDVIQAAYSARERHPLRQPTDG